MLSDAGRGLIQAFVGDYEGTPYRRERLHWAMCMAEINRKRVPSVGSGEARWANERVRIPELRRWPRGGRRSMRAEGIRARSAGSA